MSKRKKSKELLFDEDFNAAHQVLREKSRILDNVLNALGDGLSIHDRNMRIVYQNKYMIDTFGSHIGEYCYNAYEKRDKICDGCPITEAYQTGKVARALRIGITGKGDKFRFENIASVLRNDNGEIIAGLELVRLVEDRESALDKLREATNKLMQAKAVFENSSDGIMVLDPDNHVISVNPAFESITGYNTNEANQHDLKFFNSGRQSDDFYNEMLTSLIDKGSWRGELWNRHKDGHVYAVLMTIDTIFSGNGEVKQHICVFSDITEKKQVEQRIEHLAQHDILTNLPNRMLYTDRLEHAIALAKREKGSFVLLFIDLDYFKEINDTHGHIAGDVLLQKAAKRMIECVRESDTVARIGGDEFAVLLTPTRKRNDAAVVSEKIRKTLELPFEIEDCQLHISCSIGGAFYPEDGLTGDELTRKADQAMYQAKITGRNKVIFTDT